MSKENKILKAQGIEELRRILIFKDPAVKETEENEKRAEVKKGWRNNYKLSIALRTFDAHMDNFLKDRRSLTFQGLVHETNVAMIESVRQVEGENYSERDLLILTVRLMLNGVMGLPVYLNKIEKDLYVKPDGELTEKVNPEQSLDNLFEMLANKDSNDVLRSLNLSEEDDEVGEQTDDKLVWGPVYGHSQNLLRQFIDLLRQQNQEQAEDQGMGRGGKANSKPARKRKPNDGSDAADASSS